MLTFFACGLMVTSWLVPDHYYPWTTFYNDWLAWGALLLLLLRCVFNHGVRTVALPVPAIVVACLAVVPLLQWYVGSIFFAGDAVMAALYLLGLALAIGVGASLKSADLAFFDKLAWAVALGASLSVFLALHQWLRLDGWGAWVIALPPGERPYANLAQPNNLASLLCAGMVSVLYLRERGHLGRFVCAFVGLLLLVGVAMTRSRMSILIIVVLAIYLLWSGRRFRFRCAQADIWIGLAIFLMFWFVWPSISDVLLLPRDDSLARVQGSFSTEVRWVIWRQLLDAVLHGPWAGYGWNQVSVAQMVFAAEYPRSMYVEHAHNLVIDLLCWNGLWIGGVIVILGIGWFYSRIRRVGDLSGWFGISIVLVFLVHSMFEFPLDYGMFLVPFGMAIGLIEAGYGGRVISISRLALAGVWLLGMLFFAWIFVEYRIVEEDFRLLRYEAAGIGKRSSETLAPDVFLLSQNREFIRFARTEAKPDMSAVALEQMRQVAFRFAYPPSMFRYALALGLNGQPELARLELIRLRQLHPPMRYQEAIDGWQILSKEYPVLNQVRLPDLSGK